jgi:hypothetical protein
MDIINVLKEYENNPIIRPLLQLIPLGIGSGIDSLLVITLSRMRQERAKIFFDEITKGNINPNNRYLETDDFVHKYILTMRHVLNTNQKEKIEMFAKILKNSLNENNKIFAVDIFEDFIGILNELTFHEINALSLLETYDTVIKEVGENGLMRVNKFWSKFEERMENELNVPKSYVNNFMIRITRTGCYEEFNGNYFGYTGGKGELTPLYYELKKMIMENVE